MIYAPVIETANILKILGDRLELVDRPTFLSRKRSDHLFEAMIEMILDEGLLGLGDRLFNSEQLLGDI